jgi:hypothetical protein
MIMTFERTVLIALWQIQNGVFQSEFDQIEITSLGGHWYEGAYSDPYRNSLIETICTGRLSKPIFSFNNLK